MRTFIEKYKDRKWFYVSLFFISICFMQIVQFADFGIRYISNIDIYKIYPPTLHQIYVRIIVFIGLGIILFFAICYKIRIEKWGSGIGRKIRNSSMLIAIIAVLICILPFPCSVHTTLTGIRWTNGDASKSDPVEIKIKGIYLQYLFRDNTFHGRISISGIDSTSSDTLQEVEFNKNLRNHGQLVYYGSDSAISLGDIIFKGNFDHIVIRLIDQESGDWSEEYISAPANDRQAGVDLATALYEKEWEKLS